MPACLGLFSPREINEGTRLLLADLEVAPAADCLDLGVSAGLFRTPCHDIVWRGC